MSKKTSKILVLAVVAILVVAMVGLVACGPKGPAPLEAASAMSTLQTGFNEAETKEVHEVITVGGIKMALNVAALGINLDLRVNNVTIDMTRKYEDGVLSIDATIKDLDIKVGGLAKIMNLVGSFLDKATAAKLNVDDTVISNLKNVSIHAACDIDADMVVTVNDFTIYGLDQVKDANGKQLGVLTNGDGEALGAKYTPGELVGQVVDPRHESTGAAGDADGMFVAMNALADGSGDTLEAFLKDNYQMISLYDFPSVEIADTAISYNGDTNLDKVYGIAQDMIDAFASTEIAKNAQNQAVTVGDILDTAFASRKIDNILAKFIDMGAVKMTGNIKADGEAWKLADMTSEQTITLTIDNAFLTSVLNIVKSFGVDLSKFEGIINPVLKAIDTISTPINAKTVATFNY